MAVSTSASPISDALPNATPQANPSGEYVEIDRALRSRLAQLTLGLSPASLVSAYTDWLTHLAGSPGKQVELLSKVQHNVMQLARQGMPKEGHASDANAPPLPQDHRFQAPQWQTWPFSGLYQAFLMNQQWWHDATTGVDGVSTHHAQMAAFYSRQWLDMFSPSNFLATNPEVLAETLKTSGANLVRGAQNRITDAMRTASSQPAPAMAQFRPGHEVAITPGKVVFSNHLIELIQYTPQTPTVLAEPVLMVPSWIMKFYILDLSPGNSLVRYLVEQGHTVFMVSWKNPGTSDRDLGMDDYLKSGVMAAIDAVSTALPQRKIQAMGYCLGGTLLAIAAAALGREGDKRLKSLTLLASEVDFTEPGELALFIDETQLAYVDSVMSEKGYLDGKQMAGAFAMLNARDLVWSRMEHEYLMGRSLPVNDLIAWNSDATRMPYRQHHEYLHSLYLRNDLAEGRYLVDGKPVLLADIGVPMFVLGTQRDTVSPWQSVYKIHDLTPTDISFCLSSGGHNVGVVNPPGPGVKRSYQMLRRAAGDPTVDPEAWLDAAPVCGGSWWPAWTTWLAAHSGKRVPPPPLGGKTGNKRRMVDAPGHYVLAT